MWHQLWIPVLLPTLIIKSNCDTNETESNIFIRGGGHVDRDYKIDVVASNINDKHETREATNKEISTTHYYEETTTAGDAIVFVPNDAAVNRADDEYDNRVRMNDVMGLRTVSDALNKKVYVEKADEEPNEDIVFISGKNRDHDKEDERRRYVDNTRRSDSFNQIEARLLEDEIPRPKLTCNDLDCNNTIKSICGAKFVNKEWKFRLFINDCYFRKVNCAFKYEANRYKQVTVDKCRTVGAHYAERPFAFKPKSFIPDNPPQKAEIAVRRSSSSRRSMTKDANGEFCSHPCPVTCPEDYDPQCAISGTGQKRVFMNHCKLDLNSCFYSVVWHKSPLADCVGGQKADLRHNRGFIGWMQRVGIVDNRGRLVVE